MAPQRLRILFRRRRPGGITRRSFQPNLAPLHEAHARCHLQHTLGRPYIRRAGANMRLGAEGDAVSGK